MSGQGTRKLTDQQIAQLIDWYEAGRSYKWIAPRLGVSLGAVHYQRLKAGAISPNEKGRRGTAGPMQFVDGAGRTQRRFTPEEDRRLVELEMAGLRYKAIAREMGRAYTSVRIRLMTLALHDELAA